VGLGDKAPPRHTLSETKRPPVPAQLAAAAVRELVAARLSAAATATAEDCSVRRPPPLALREFCLFASENLDATSKAHVEVEQHREREAAAARDTAAAAKEEEVDPAQLLAEVEAQDHMITREMKKECDPHAPHPLSGAGSVPWPPGLTSVCARPAQPARADPEAANLEVQQQHLRRSIPLRPHVACPARGGVGNW
jgi:hypothetical protein